MSHPGQYLIWLGQSLGTLDVEPEGMVYEPPRSVFDMARLVL